MRELLPDNIALAERLEALPAHTSYTRTPETREIGALPTWISAFLTFVAVVAEAHPQRVKDMLAYMRLLTREAQKYGGTGWLTYDQVFRRNRTGVAARWDVLDPSLHIAYISAQGDTAPVTPCSICSEVDHRPQDCALAALAPSTKRPAPATQQNDLIRSRHGKRPIRPSSQRRICPSWNRGKCLYEGSCNYSHTCATCGGPHQAKGCSRTSPDSGFRQPKPSPKAQPADQDQR